LSRSKHKGRLDQLLQEQRPDLSRSRVQAEIMAGKVLVNGQVYDKPGTLIESSASIELLEPENPYVSRGGLKLEGAIKDFNLSVADLTVLDVGASTGGFTDCLLQKGARIVYALDVGYGQLDYGLREDPRVVIMERFNVRHLKENDLPETPDLAVIDVSFISLSKVLPVLGQLNIPAILALIKPQFEAGREDATKGEGVIRDPGLHRKILINNIQLSCSYSYCCRGITYSKWPGPKGNLEYFIYYKRKESGSCTCQSEYFSIASSVVDQAHLVLLRPKK